MKEKSKEADQGANKFDNKKLPIHLIPPEAIIAEAMVLGYGVRKYGENNWAKGMEWSRLFGSVLRHLVSWWVGLSKDDESNMLHLAHARAALGFLLAYEQRGIGTDDRRYDARLEALLVDWENIIEVYKDV